MKQPQAVTANLPEFVKAQEPGVWSLNVWVQPGAKKDELAGLHQGCLKVRVGAPAVDNKANEALVTFIAGILGVKPRQVELVSGHASRRKCVRVESSTEPRWAGVAQAGLG